MAGIRVDIPKGDGWEHSLNQTDWQTSRIFLTQPGGAAFVVGVEYTVYSRHLVDNVFSVGKIIFSESTNEVKLLRQVQSATPAERRAAFLLMLQAVKADPDASEEFCEAVGSCTIVPVAPPPRFSNFIHYREVADVVVDSIDVETVASEWEPDEVPDSIDVETVGSEWEPISNPGPTLVNPQNDVVITEAGDYLIEPPASEFADNAGDTHTLQGFKYDGGSNTELPLPSGITFDADTGNFIVADSFADTGLVLRRKYIDSAGQSAADDFLVIVNRTEAPTLTGYSLPDIDVSEGDSSPEIQVTAHFSDGSSTQYTGAGNYSLIAPYPDDMTLTPGPNATAVAHVAEDSITANVPVPYRFTFPDNEFIEGIITAVNAGGLAFEISHAAIWRDVNDDISLLYKSPQSGNQVLEDYWTGFDPNNEVWLGTGYGTPPVTGRPAGFENYQYLGSYGHTAGQTAALQGITTLKLRKVGQTVNLIDVDFDGSTLDPGEVQIIYPPQN